MKNNLFDKNKKYRNAGLLLIAAVLIIAVLMNVKFQSVSEHNRDQQRIVEDYQKNAAGQTENNEDQKKATESQEKASENATDESLAQGEAETKTTQGGSDTKAQESGSDIGNNDETKSATEQVTETATKETTAEYVNFTFAITCRELADNLDQWSNKTKASSVVPANGIIQDEISVKLKVGSSVYDATRYVAALKNISVVTQFSSDYVMSIANISEKDANKKVGSCSGWMYYVNNIPPGAPCSTYIIAEGDHIVWEYSVFYKP